MYINNIEYVRRLKIAYTPARITDKWDIHVYTLVSVVLFLPTAKTQIAGSGGREMYKQLLMGKESYFVMFCLAYYLQILSPLY